MRVSDYLGYLRDMSRKIAFRGGFEACLGRPAVDRVPPLHGSPDSPYAGMSRGTWLAQARQRMIQEDDLGVYVGYGLLAGKITIGGRSRAVAGPLIIVPADVAPDDDSAEDVHYEHEDSLLNYDLLALLIPGADSVQDGASPVDQPVLFTKELLEAIEKAEDYIEAATANGLPGNPVALARAVYDFLAAQIPALAAFSYRNDGCPAPADLQRLMQSSAGQFINCEYLFLAVRPSEVTTYQALTKLIKQTAGEHGGEGVQNPVLARLLQSSIEQIATSLDRSEEIRAKVYTDVVPLIPLSLSEPQKKAVADAWASDISYVQGPPGTGKSHTITAMLLSAVLMGKKVLLVSNKKAALDVVRVKVEKTLGDGALGVAVGDPEGRRRQKGHIEELINRADNVRASDDYRELRTRVENLRRQIEVKLAELYAQEDIIEVYLLGAQQVQEALQRLCQERDFYQGAYAPDDLRAVGLGGRVPVDDALVALLGQLSRQVEQARASGSGLSRPKALKVRTLLSFATHELGGSWLRAEARPVDAMRRLEAYVKALRAAHELARRERSVDARIGEVRRLLASKQEEHQTLCVQLAKTQLDMIRLARAAEHLPELQRFKQVFFYRKAARLKALFASTKVADALTACPLWAAEIKDLSAVFPFELGLFDLVVVDEASQVNIAELIPAFYRGTRFCVVGDDRQLGLGAAGLFALNRNFERLAWERHCEGVSYESAKTRSILVTEHSILDLILRSPYAPQLPQVMLDEHFRSRPALANFTSQEFYSDSGGLKIMTESAANLGKGSFRVVITGGTRRPNLAIVDEEVAKAIEILTAIEDRSAFARGGVLEGQSAVDVDSVGVVAYTRDQVDELREKTQGRFRGLQLIIGTPEELQGNERDVILLTFGLGAGTRYAKGHYENPNRFNVATSRARLFTIAILGAEPSTAERLRRYLNLNDDTHAAFSFPEFKPDRVIGEPRQFLAAELVRYVRERSARQPTRPIALHAGVSACGQSAMDFVLINQAEGRGLVIELDGAPGYALTQHYPALQRDRVAIMARAGYGVVHLRCPELYEDGWLKQGASLEALRTRLANDLDRHLFRA